MQQIKRAKLKVKAHVQFEGVHAPTSAELEFESIPSEKPFCYIDQVQSKVKQNNKTTNETKPTLTEEEKQKVLNEVELQQTEFGEKHLK